MSTAPVTNDCRLFLQICSEVTQCNLPGQILNRIRANRRVLVLVSLAASEPEQPLDQQVLLDSPSNHRPTQCLVIWRTQVRELLHLNPPQPAASTSAFGAPKPTTGLFGGGGTSAFGSGGNTFGSTTGTGTTVFGSSPNTGGAFGSFGQNRTTTGFGVTSPTTANDTTAPVTTGTSNPPYSSFSEKDPTSTSTLQYQTITAMPAYRGTSLEELRYQD
ncbi:hypothetical protein BDR07DRAFT_538991 [Suillus spraguei]|nr:hypothetical protein BDR07DRAFT_538991 [Suillus spraguei]